MKHTIYGKFGITEAQIKAISNKINSAVKEDGRIIVDYSDVKDKDLIVNAIKKTTIILK